MRAPVAGQGHVASSDQATGGMRSLHFLPLRLEVHPGVEEVEEVAAKEQAVRKVQPDPPYQHASSQTYQHVGQHDD